MSNLQVEDQAIVFTGLQDGLVVFEVEKELFGGQIVTEVGACQNFPVDLSTDERMPGL